MTPAEWTLLLVSEAAIVLVTRWDIGILSRSGARRGAYVVTVATSTIAGLSVLFRLADPASPLWLGLALLAPWILASAFLRRG